MSKCLVFKEATAAQEVGSIEAAPLTDIAEMMSAAPNFSVAACGEGAKL